MRLLFGRPVPTQGRQPEIQTAPAVHLPTLSVSQTGQLDGDHPRLPRSPSCAARQHRRVSFLRLTLGGSEGLPSKHGDSEMRFHVSFRCWLLGHEDFVRCTHDRLYLECIECGRETKGWPIGKSNRSGDPGSGKRTRAMVACVRFAKPAKKTATLKAA